MPTDRTPWDRQRAIVDDLSHLQVDTELDETMPGILDEAVCGILLRHNATLADFRSLDEKPGAAPLGGYRFNTAADDAAGRPNREWHWKLRRVRNRCPKLFDCLDRF
jgi:hypothetical protein